ncbi:MAG: hypothetical protein M3O82_02885 [Verrucomicrobiota bacterium]|nr:hypothetical protein [Verrucomicrobiota bacterium]
MKKLLFALLFAVIALTVVPAAQAHCYRRERVILYYDSCGDPVYGYVTRDTDDYYSYRQPRYSYGGDYGYYQPRRDYYRPSRGGVSFFFGR